MLLCTSYLIGLSALSPKKRRVRAAVRVIPRRPGRGTGNNRGYLWMLTFGRTLLARRNNKY